MSDFFEFGPFRLEPASRSLFRDGEFIAVTPKAFDTLCVLVEEAGRVVTKDELLQRVWPDAFVEEGSIANNISALRKILNPHFEGDGPIVTISRRGYRFTAPVHLRNAEAQIGVIADSGPLDEETLAAIAQVPEIAAPEMVATGTSRARTWAVAAGVALVAGAIAITLANRVTTAAPSEVVPMRRAVAVLSMKNLSGNADYGWFSTALSEAINTELNAGNQLRIISGAAVAQMQQELGVQPTAGLSRKQLDEIGSNLGCDLILTGTYLHSNGRVSVDLRLDDIATGSPVTTVTVEDDEARLLDLVASASRQLRLKLNLTPPLAGQIEAARASLSSNPNALRYYFLGLDALRNHEIPRSIELLTQAVTDDPNFALAHSVLSTSWRVLGYDDKSESAAKKSFDLSSRLGREDQLLVQGAYYTAMGDVPKSIEKFQALWNFFPDDIAYGLRVTHQLILGGRLDDARRVIDQLRALPPPADSDPRVDVVEARWHFRKSNYADAQRIAAEGAEKARRRKSNQLLAILTMVQGNSAVQMNDLAGARNHFAAAQKLYEGLDDVGGVADAIRADAGVLQATNELQQAERRLDQALDAVAKINHQRMLTEVRIARASLAIQLGKLAPARTDAEVALAAARQQNNRSSAARALTELGRVAALQGDSGAARRHLEEAVKLGRDIGEPQVAKAAEAYLAEIDRSARNGIASSP